jgi:hypothetical protein
VGNREDEALVGPDVRGVAALAHDFAASIVLIFGTVGICRKSGDVKTEWRWLGRPSVASRDFYNESRGTHYCSQWRKGHIHRKEGLQRTGADEQNRLTNLMRAVVFVIRFAYLAFKA